MCAYICTANLPEANATHPVPSNIDQVHMTSNWLDTEFTDELGAVSIRKTVLPGMAIPMLKIRRPNGRLIFNMEIAIRR